ncbi:hypothetical protein PAPHI01_0954 [Pancytospora philotis]|nr:hypothetical protein PAPHI01_0954 [Pancytospora philotis]
MGSVEAFLKHMKTYTRPEMGVPPSPVCEVARKKAGPHVISGYFDRSMAIFMSDRHRMLGSGKGAVDGQAADVQPSVPEAKENKSNEADKELPDPFFSAIEQDDELGPCEAERERRCMDDSYVANGMYNYVDDPTARARRTIAEYNLAAELSLHRAMPRKSKFIDGILSFNDQVARVIRGDPSVAVNVLSSKYRYCKNKVVDTVKIDLVRDGCTNLPGSSTSDVDIASNYNIKYARRFNYTIKFYRIFNPYDFCNDNRFVSLRACLYHLLVLDIDPRLFMKARIIGFYNQDVAAVQLADDILFFSLCYDIKTLPLAQLTGFLKDCMATQSGDPASALLFAHIAFQALVNGRREPAESAERSIGRVSAGIRSVVRSLGNLVVSRKHAEAVPCAAADLFDLGVHIHSDRISVNGCDFDSTLPAQMRSGIRESVHRKMQGFSVVSTVYGLAVVCRRRGIHLEPSFIAPFCASLAVAGNDSIAAVALLDTMGVRIGHELTHTYRQTIARIADKFCVALNAVLKESVSSVRLWSSYCDSGVLFNSIAWILERAPVPAGGAHGGEPATTGEHVQSCFMAGISKVYIKRIRKTKTILDLEPIYLSILHSNRLFGVCWPVEAELKRMVRLHAVREARGWPTGGFGEKIRSILNE